MKKFEVGCVFLFIVLCTNVAFAFDAKLKDVLFYTEGGCQEGWILVRPLFEIPNINPADLVVADVGSNECKPYMRVIKTVTTEGYIAYEFCASPNWSVPAKMRFIKFSTGELSDILYFNFDVQSAPKITTTPPKLTSIK